MLSIRGLQNRKPCKQGFKPNTTILQGKAFTGFSREVQERQCSSLNKPWPFFPQGHIAALVSHRLYFLGMKKE